MGGQMVDELKIQLESRGDALYLQEELARHMAEHHFDTTAAERQEFVDSVFAIVKENVQIDGQDFAALAAEDGGEQVDAALEARLESLQGETDSLLVQIAALRRTVPGEARAALEAAISGLEGVPIDGERLFALGDGSDALLRQLAAETASPEVPSIALDDQQRLSQEITQLALLNKTLPDVVAKLKRAQTVLGDSSNFGGATGGLVEGLSEGAENAASDAVNRQRRIARQNDLALKLAAQK